MSKGTPDAHYINRHFHWDFVAYNGEPGADTIKWAVRVEVIGYLSEADARVAAQDIVTRDQYALARVWECASCGFQEQYAASIQQLADKEL